MISLCVFGSVVYAAPNLVCPLSNASSFESTHTISANRNAELLLPIDIFGKADYNSCSKLITRGLEVLDQGKRLTALRWQLSGATKGQSVKYGINQLKAHVFNIGVTTVKYNGKFKDGSDFNYSFKVEVKDSQPPRILEAPGNLMVSTSPGECTAKVGWKDLIVEDNCVSQKKIKIRSSHKPGDEFAIGLTEVEYLISDGVNEIRHRFNIVVLDDEQPFLSIPEPIEVNCGEAVPDAFTSWTEFETSGGKTADNCGVDYSSFRYVDQYSTGIFCPYSVIRTYSISDVYGNLTHVKHFISVRGFENELEATHERSENNGLIERMLKSASSPQTVSIGLVGITNVSCYGASDGAIDLDTSSTNGPITSIVWDHGPTTLDVSGLSAGSYTVRITDGDGEQSRVYEITQPPDLVLNLVGTDPSCKGGNDGLIDLTVSGGTPSYFINWDNGIGSVEDPGTLSAGTYQVQVTDANNCTQSASYTLGEPNELSVTAIATDVTCNGGSDGEINLTISGGTPPYAFAWDIITGNVEDPSGLSANTYNVVVSDSKGCTASASAMVSEPASLSASTNVTHVGCYGGSDGGIDLTVSGGTEPYSYAWNNGVPSLQDPTGLIANTYEVTISDAENCSLSLTVEVNEPDELTLSYSATDVTCNGGSDGAIDLTVGGGTLPYTFLWNNGIGNIEDPGGLPVGTYLVTIRDGNNCNSNESIVIDQPVVLNAVTGSENITCNGANDGTITISSPSGGHGNYEYRINSGSWQNAATFQNLNPGDYSIEIRDADHSACERSLGMITLTEPDPLTAPNALGAETICYNAVPAGLTASSATGGNNVFSYQWQQSTDGLTWNDIPGETTLSYSPPALLVDTYFRVEATELGLPSCGTVYSNSVVIAVVDDEAPTFTAPGNVTVYAESDCTPPTITPGITGSPTSMNDNCTSLADINVSYIDDPNYVSVGSCYDYIINRTWTVKDLKGNSATAIQQIAVVDNEIPTLVVPADITIECHESSDPANTGQATATDNCDPNVSISYVDSEVLGNCYGRKTITRTWTATDCSGNEWSDQQTIRVEDNTAPVIVCPADMYVDTPDDIPLPSEINVTATDNCGAAVSVTLFEETYTGLEDGTGFCPKTVTKFYEAVDSCGNRSTCSFVIYVDDLDDCYICQGEVKTHYVSLDGQPDGTIILEDIRRDEEGVCCDFKSKKNMRCTSFNIELDDDAVGVTILVNGALPNPKDYRLNCFDIDPINDVICIPGTDIELSEFYTFVYCKEGNNPNDFSFISIPGAVATGDLATRVDCSGQIDVEGVLESSVTFTDVSGNGYERFLDPPSGSLNPIFTPDSTAPAIIQYEVCGNIYGAGDICAGGVDCDIATITVLPRIEISFNIDPQAVCENNPPTIEVSINPEPSEQYEYEYWWYSGYDATGTPLNSVSSETYQPSITGEYSIKVIETKTGVICNEATHNFDWAYDYTPYNVFGPGNDLTIECNDYNPQDIIDWLALAYVEDEYGNLLPDNVTNDFTGIDQSCGEVLPVVFSAFDDCGNLGTDTAYIFVSDNTPPLISPEATPASVECVGSDPDQNPSYLSWLANYGGAAASDLCDDNLTWTIDTASATWSNDPANNQITITFTVTDDCGNHDQTSAVFTITDTQAPTITCPADVVEIAASNNCSKALGQLTDPTMADDCSIPVLTYTRDFPDGTSDNGTGTVTGLDFPIGLTTVTYKATDAADLTASCSFGVTIVDTTPPGISIGCFPVSGTVPPDSCSGVPIGLLPPEYSDDCWPEADLTLNYKIRGASYANGTGSVLGMRFNLGVSIVTYIVSDPDGLQDSCSFTVTMTRDNFPSSNITCPSDSVWAAADPLSCEAFVNLDTLVWVDPCNELDSIWHNSPYSSDPKDASGTYPIGTTAFTWYSTDLSGNIDSCNVMVVVDDVDAPSLTGCPDTLQDIVDAANCTINDFALQQPVYSEVCGATLRYELIPVTSSTSGNGLDYVPANQVFTIGQTLVRYVLEDTGGNTDTCEFIVWAKHQDFPSSNITCPPDSVWAAADPLSCEAFVNLDTLVWVDPCNELDSIWHNSPYSSDPKDASGSYPIGTTAFTWYITDLSGNIDSCNVMVVVDDVDAPSLTGCPDTLQDIVDAANCTINDFALQQPVYSEVCGATLRYELIPVTSSTSGNGLDYVPANQVFTIGQTLVRYVLEDTGGNTDTCEFIVWAKHQDFPSSNITCPSDSVWAAADPLSCEAFVNLDTLVWVDPCNELDSIWHNSPYSSDPKDASGAYPIGTTAFTWYITDLSGNIDSCNVKVVVDDVDAPQFLSCPDTLEDVVADDNCSMTNFSLVDPTYNELCGAELSYTLIPVSSSTSGSGSGLIPSSQVFGVGQTLVQYVLEDQGGNRDTCEFIVWAKHLSILPSRYQCPQPEWIVDADDGVCGAYLSLDTLAITSNPCNEFDSIWHDSPYGTDSMDASGIYPIGTTTFNWYLSDVSGNIVSCQVRIVVNDIPPSISCPSDYVFNADFDQPFKSDTLLERPVFNDNCPDSILTWEMLLPDGSRQFSPSTGVNFVPNDTFYLGVSTVWYTVTDSFGNWDSCSFTITVLGAPEIECPPDTVFYLDGTEANCEVNYDPGVPDLIEGVPPIDWSYTINYADGRPSESFSYSSPAPGNANPLGQLDFPLGVSTIEWRAENISGWDTCSHWIEVIDTITPRLDAQNYEYCVDPIHWAMYNPTAPNPVYGVGKNMEISPSPDYHTFESGNTALDLVLLEDNCCDSSEMIVHWEIVFTDVYDPLDPTGSALISHDTIRGTGQPSTYTNPVTGFPEDIKLWGDGVYFDEVTHSIEYWVEDCNGNLSQNLRRLIVIKPRPEIVKENY